MTHPPADVARVLLIEDDPSVRSVLCRLLSQAGHDVLDTSDPASALGLVVIHRADVVITDVMVSGQDGIALLVAIRHSFPDLPLIAISGRHQEEIAERLEESGLRSAVWFLAKPFEGETLVATVQAALPANGL